ncbi:MAG: UDP-N-acetylmuramate--L-alanine ligase [Candidatus Gracilibacteria bacterium]|nr:UDP-N-acetylmuramate--L-alanine ligase [Candidatus Gracilibacteria bacterium]
MKKIYFVGIGGIGVSGLARYYLHAGYSVYGSDKYDSELIGELKKEGANIIVGEDEDRINNDFEKVVYTEAVPLSQSELQKAQDLGINIETYPVALSKIVNDKKLIAVSGTHGKSTTSSMISLMFHNSELNTNALVGTLLKEFDNKNAYYSDSEYFVLEACEYKRSFLAYKPYIAAITNVDLDHLDYYKDLEDYLSAFESFLSNIKPGGYAILNGEEENSKKLIGLREDINYAVIYNNYFELNNKKYYFENYELLIPGEHIKYDSKIAYVAGKIAGLSDDLIIENLKKYSGAWRRMEIIKTSVNNNILMSDYGHHPNEIEPTLASIKQKFPDKKLIVFFEPHQYSRTLELLEEFKNCFGSADKIIIPSIYESRDSDEDKAKINAKKFTDLINHNNKLYGVSLKNAENILKQEDENNNNAILLLLGAGNIDNLRNIL